MKDACPNGDNSGSYYDGKCDGTTTQIVPSIVAASSSSKDFLTSNPIIGTYDFTKDERIPQKVAAELNFFVTKLVKILDAKSGQDNIKKQAYYQTIAKYMLQRAKKSNNKREKRIFSYLYTRFLVVTKIEVK